MRWCLGFRICFDFVLYFCFLRVFHEQTYFVLVHETSVVIKLANSHCWSDRFSFYLRRCLRLWSWKLRNWKLNSITSGDLSREWTHRAAHHRCLSLGSRRYSFTDTNHLGRLKIIVHLCFKTIEVVLVEYLRMTRQIRTKRCIVETPIYHVLEDCRVKPWCIMTLLRNMQLTRLRITVHIGSC